MHMTIPKLSALIARWKIVPPMSTTVAAIASGLGIDLRISDGKTVAPVSGPSLEQAKAEAALLNRAGS